MPDVDALRPVDGGEDLAVETVDGQLRFIARDVPPMGYRTYVPVRAAGSCFWPADGDTDRDRALPRDARSGAGRCPLAGGQGLGPRAGR